MIAMFLFVVVSCLLSFSHGGSVVTNTAECYKSEDILDCRGDAIKFFSGEIDPSINRVLMNHIMTSEQIENVRMKASCVFELSLSGKELCDTVQGKIIVLNGEECSSYKLKMIAMFLFVVVSCLLSFSHGGSVVTNTAECYKSEDILDCRGDAIKFFSGEIDPSTNRVLMNHIMTSEQIENVRMKASCVFELSLSGKELCDTVQGKIIVLNGEECSSYKLKMIAMFLFVVVSCLLSFSHGGSVVTNTAECYKSEDILDCRGDAIKFFSGEIDPSTNRVLMNHIMTSEQIENVRMKASCVFELSLSGKELCDTVQGKIIVLNGEECSSYHGANCDKCSRVDHVHDLITTEFSKVLVNESVQDDIDSDLNSTRKNLLEWKRHLLRTVHQDAARNDILKNLTPSQSLSIMNLAMKFLPVHFLETQLEFSERKVLVGTHPKTPRTSTTGAPSTIRTVRSPSTIRTVTSYSSIRPPSSVKTVRSPSTIRTKYKLI
ncbi:Hypothetical predicted protein [Mytilus galloprovincialis]|uniref:Uncharacterized protein n=1 Tax=Mytilus galloprovincialis TaxID=29158 RepID=A0A8B6FZA6_MYTGA|nr:Hypothetical predicted protein [Mytilus galloprovincialis]